jgi:hypothetical protein
MTMAGGLCPNSKKKIKTSALGMVVPEEGTLAAINAAVPGFCGSQKIGNLYPDPVVIEIIILIIVVRPTPIALSSSRCPCGNQRPNRSVEMVSPISSAAAK